MKLFASALLIGVCVSQDEAVRISVVDRCVRRWAHLYLWCMRGGGSVCALWHLEAEVTWTARDIRAPRVSAILVVKHSMQTDK